MLVVSLSSDKVISKAQVGKADSVFIGPEFKLIGTGFSIAQVSEGLVCLNTELIKH